eukprot:tig00001127_g7140.t1
MSTALMAAEQPSCEEEIGIHVGSRLKNIDLFPFRIVGSQSRIGGVLSLAALLLTAYFVLHTSFVHLSDADQIVAQGRAARPFHEPLELPAGSILWELADASGRPVANSVPLLSLESVLESGGRGQATSSRPAPVSEGSCSLPAAPDGTLYASGLSCYAQPYSVSGSLGGPQFSRLRLRLALRSPDAGGTLEGHELRVYAVTRPGAGPAAVEARRAPLAAAAPPASPSQASPAPPSPPTLSERAAASEVPLSAIDAELSYSPSDWATPGALVAEIEFAPAAYRIEETVRSKSAVPLVLGWAAFWTLMTITLGTLAAAYNRHTFSRIGMGARGAAGTPGSSAAPSARPGEMAPETALARELEALGDKLARERYRDMVPLGGRGSRGAPGASGRATTGSLVLDVASGLPDAQRGPPSGSPTAAALAARAAQVALSPKFDDLGGKQLSPRPSVHKARQHLESLRKESRYSPAGPVDSAAAVAALSSGSHAHSAGAAPAPRYSDPPAYPAPRAALAAPYPAPASVSNSVSSLSSASSTLYRDPASLYGTYSGHPAPSRRYRPPGGHPRSPRDSRSNTDASSDGGGWLSQDGYGSDDRPSAALGGGGGPTAFSRVARGPPAGPYGPPEGSDAGAAPSHPRFEGRAHTAERHSHAR